MSEDVLLVKEADGVVTLTLNRPEVMNSLNFQLLFALRDAVESVRFRRDIRVIIITGAGDKAFCSGADLKERATLAPEKVREYIFTIRNLFTAIEQLNKPVIAAVNGIALGGGTELALASDIRIASKTATMGLTETRLAIIPGAGGTQRLPRLVGLSKAMDILLRGKAMGPEEALAIGLVDRLIEPEIFMEEVMKFAEQLASGAGKAMGYIKAAVYEGIGLPMEQALAVERKYGLENLGTHDAKEGLVAFAEKRKPNFLSR